MATKEQRRSAIEHAADYVKRHNLRGDQPMTPRPDCYIKASETRRSIAEKRKQKEIKATLYVFQRPVCEILANTSQDDQSPHGSAIALLWLKFQQQVGPFITYDVPGHDEATSGRNEGGDAAS
jgi:hypothetical protein